MSSNSETMEISSDSTSVIDYEWRAAIRIDSLNGDRRIMGEIRKPFVGLPVIGMEKSPVVVDSCRCEREVFLGVILTALGKLGFGFHHGYIDVHTLVLKEIGSCPHPWGGDLEGKQPLCNFAYYALWGASCYVDDPSRCLMVDQNLQHGDSVSSGQIVDLTIPQAEKFMASWSLHEIELAKHYRGCEENATHLPRTALFA